MNNHRRLYVFFVLLSLCFVGVAQAQSSVYNFRWLGATGLALSGQPEDSAQWETVKSFGINATLNLRGEAQDNETFLSSIGIEYYQLSVIANGADDSWNLTEQQVDGAVHWINNCLAEGKKVLIHCQVGQNRAPTMAMMWYIHEGHNASEAYSWVLQYPISEPFDHQQEHAADYYEWLLQQPTPTPPPTPTPTPTLTSTPAPSPTPNQTPASTATSSPQPTQAPTPSSTPTSTILSTPTSKPVSEDFPTAIVTAVAIIAAIAGAALPLYFKNRHRTSLTHQVCLK